MECAAGATCDRLSFVVGEWKADKLGMIGTLRHKAISGIIWTFSQQFGTQFINFIIQIILARILMPADFGVIAILTVFIAIGSSMMDSGLTLSLIRTEKPDNTD